METFCVELTKELELCDLQLEKLVLPGRPDGRPPTAVSLVLFFLRSAMHLCRHHRRYDIIHLGDFVLSPLGAVSKLFGGSAVIVVMVHGLDIIYGRRSGFRARVYSVFVSMMRRLSFADQYVANSSHTGSLCREEQLGPVEVIPLGVRPTESERHESQVEVTRNVLFIGRLVKRKGASWFAEHVLPRLPQEIRMLVVGQTWDADEERALRAHDRVDILGFVDDETLDELKRSSLVAVMPNQPSENNSDVEGFGLIAVELAIAGVPLVASNIEGLTSAVRNGETGFLVPHDEHGAWASKIMEIADWSEEERSRYKHLCTNGAKTYYSWERVAKSHTQLYAKVASPQ